MILVAGGTGRLGSLLVAGLAARGRPVRVLTRDPARASHLGETPTEVVRGDVRDPASLEPALEGASTVVSAVHGFAGPGRVTPVSVDERGNANLIDLAATREAEIVLVSVVGASPDSPLEISRAKYAAEQRLRASGAAWTIVRATAFVELWADIMRKPLVFGRGDNPVNFVSVLDVATVVERAVLDSGLREQVVEVGGPQNLSFNQLAALLQRLRGHDGQIHHVPRWLLRTLAPLSRRARAAVVMDTADMSFDSHAIDGPVPLPLTDVEAALTRMFASDTTIPRRRRAWPSATRSLS
jgi:NADH dehydrogenase